MMIDKVGDKCTGCYACMNACPKNCIYMIENTEGFWFPQIDNSKCIECNLCEKACSILSPISINKEKDDVKVYALIHKDSDIRKESSSGGAFSAIANYVLSKGGVVFGAAFDENFDVHHICIDKKEDLYKLRGSKYVQSRIGDTYKQAKEYLKTGRLVLFTGTACQTSGLVGYLGRDYDNLVTQDLICHGVPSPLAWKKYIQLRKELAKSDIESIFFRDKTYGWHNWHIAFKFKNGMEYKQDQREDMMIKSFLRGKCSRKSCYDCAFKQKYRLADFTLADYWGIEHIAPELDDDKGISSCYVNSSKAARIFECIKSETDYREMDLDTAISYNEAMIESEKLSSDRDDFLKDLNSKSFDMVVGKYIDEIGISTTIKWTVRRILGERTYEFIKSKISRG